AALVEQVFAELPFGIPGEETPGPAGSRLNSSSLRFYGLRSWSDLFTPRQLLCLGVFAKQIRRTQDTLRGRDYSQDWALGLARPLYASLARLADRNSELCTWQIGASKIGHTFTRFAFPITWDFVEVMPWADASGGYGQAVEWIGETV